MKTALILTFCAVCALGSLGAGRDEAEKGSDPFLTSSGNEEAISFLPGNLVAANFSLAFDSKFMSYGLVDNNDPIVTPSVELTFCDWLNFGVAALFDTTRYGRDHGGYGNRAGKYIELDPSVSLAHTFTPKDCEWLPTAIEFKLGYSYEYHPEAMGHGSGEPGERTQFVTFEFGLPDIVLEPHFTYERDIDRDNGTYLNLELGHTFSLIDGAEDDSLLALRLSAAQGFGNAQRVKGYLNKENGEPLDHAGLMDTCLKAALTWNIFDNVAFGGYVAYYDFLFDPKIRDAARRYEASGRHDTNWTFVLGLSLTVSF